jgi:RNA recognition motif-containing protein
MLLSIWVILGAITFANCGRQESSDLFTPLQSGQDMNSRGLLTPLLSGQDMNSRGMTLKSASEWRQTGMAFPSSATDVFVGNLPYQIPDEEIESLVQSVRDSDGEMLQTNVLKVTVARDKETGRDKGFAFIKVFDAQQAEALVDGLNGMEFMGRILNSNVKEPRKTWPTRKKSREANLANSVFPVTARDVFVGNLPYGMSEEDVTALAHMGPGEPYVRLQTDVLRVIVPQDEETGRDKGIAFIKVLDEQQAEALARALDGMEFQGRILNSNVKQP